MLAQLVLACDIGEEGEVCYTVPDQECEHSHAELHGVEVPLSEHDSVRLEEGEYQSIAEAAEQGKEQHYRLAEQHCVLSEDSSKVIRYSMPLTVIWAPHCLPDLLPGQALTQRLPTGRSQYIDLAGLVVVRYPRLIVIAISRSPGNSSLLGHFLCLFIQHDCGARFGNGECMNDLHHNAEH